MKSSLKRRFEYLYTGELSALILFIPLSFLIHYAYPNLQLYALLSFWTSFLLLEFILIQGSYYWYTKWKRLTREKKSITPIRTVKLLKRCKRINVVLMSVAFSGFFIDLSILYPSLPIGGLLVSGFIFIFLLAITTSIFIIIAIVSPQTTKSFSDLMSIASCKSL